MAENFAHKKSSQLHILNSFFKDKTLNKSFYTKEQFDETEGSQIKESFDIFNNYLIYLLYK